MNLWPYPNHELSRKRLFRFFSELGASLQVVLNRLSKGLSQFIDRATLKSHHVAQLMISPCNNPASASSSTAKVKRLLESSSFHEGGLWFRKCAGVAIGLLGVYFILRPFFGDT